MTSRKRLIVNADDFNLTPGVNQAIFDAHDHGIVSSTTVLINRKLEAQDKRALLSREHLGTGLHLNITLGKPVSKPEEIPSLLTPEGTFKKRSEIIKETPHLNEVAIEYKNQIECFRRELGRLPSHLDTHHHLHDHSFFYPAFRAAAMDYRLPVRRSKPASEKGEPLLVPDSFLGDLDPKGYWRREFLIETLSRLPNGVHEIMCHPGIHDADLEKESSFTAGRHEEWTLFRDSNLKNMLRTLQIELVHFGMCYTSKGTIKN